MSSWGNLQDLTRLFLSGGAQTSVFDQLLDAVDTWMIRFEARRGGHIQRGPDMFILTVLYDLNIAFWVGSFGQLQEFIGSECISIHLYRGTAKSSY